jgi:hypothetical protein
MKMLFEPVTISKEWTKGGKKYSSGVFEVSKANEFLKRSQVVEHYPTIRIKAHPNKFEFKRKPYYVQRDSRASRGPVWKRKASVISDEMERVLKKYDKPFIRRY